MRNHNIHVFKRACSSYVYRMSGVFVRDGRYWYDHLCGAYGNEGGAFKGFITPGLPIGALVNHNKVLGANQAGYHTQVSG